MNRRILIIDDDRAVVYDLLERLAIEGYDVQHTHSGAVGMAMALGWRPDLVILALMLPDVDGFDLCRDLAGQAVAPIIILSVRARSEDKIRGLDIGADDYVTKPFSIGELLARIRAVLRRRPPGPPTTGTVRFADVVIDFDRGLVERGGARLPFTQKEMDLLRHLVSHPRRTFTRDELLHMVWGYQNAPLTRTVDTHVARLRQKLEADPHDPKHIQTIHGTGYVFTP